MLVSCMCYCPALKIVAICSSETSVEIQRTMQCYISEYETPHNYRCENTSLIIYMDVCIFPFRSVKFYYLEVSNMQLYNCLLQNYKKLPFIVFIANVTTVKTKFTRSIRGEMAGSKYISFGKFLNRREVPFVLSQYNIILPIYQLFIHNLTANICFTRDCQTIRKLF